MVEIEGRGRVGGSSFSLGPHYAHSGWSATLGTVPIRVQGESGTVALTKAVILGRKIMIVINIL